ncbi:MAG: DUF131 domain-containing protein [Candidatus Nanohaloarchaea archaeon]|nr:DUF131 domain-containing protein [Candidatus Nanohaloarchaea archaeon]
MDAAPLTHAGMVLLLLGAALVVAGAALGSGDSVDAEAGGVVFIGPIPIVFGSNRGVAALSLLIGAAMLAALWLWTKGL